MRLVILESPFAAEKAEDIDANIAYARASVRHSLSLGEAPIASHLLYTQPGILRDNDAGERQWGIDAGLAWRKVADATVVYTDRGISKGMAYGIALGAESGIPVEYRKIGEASRAMSASTNDSRESVIEDQGVNAKLVAEMRRLLNHFESWARDHSDEATAETWAIIHCSRAALSRSQKPVADGEEA
jgi:hypothetical protein